jgi:hypothetical protein
MMKIEAMRCLMPPYLEIDLAYIYRLKQYLVME